MSACPCGECESYAAHMRTISAAPKMNEVGRWKQMDNALAYDMAAYRAMRQQGFQPPKIDGSYDLCRRATSEAEIEMGQVISDKDGRRKKKGSRLMELTLDIGKNGMTGQLPDKDAGRRVPMKVKKAKK